MKKFVLFFSIFSFISCWKNNKEEEQYYAESNSPIDSTLVDSVVGQASFSEINSAILNSQKKDSIIPKKDSAKTSAQKLEEAKKKLEDAKNKTEAEKKKLEAEKKIAEQKEENVTKAAEKEKQQQEKKVDELIETPEN